MHVACNTAMLVFAEIAYKDRSLPFTVTLLFSEFAIDCAHCSCPMPHAEIWLAAIEFLSGTHHRRKRSSRANALPR